jgi:sugar phosphate isomerase/epimerase
MNLFINVPYVRTLENIPRLLDLGLSPEVYIDNNILPELSDDAVRELGRELQGHNLRPTVHAPFMDLSPGGFDRKVRALTVDTLKRSVEVALLLDAQGIVCHPGYDRWRFDGQKQLWLEGSISTWSAVLAEAGGKIPVMLENIFESEPSTFIALFDRFRDKNLWFCFDTGHFNLFSTKDLDNWLVPLAGRLKEMHLHDNHGSSDDHLPIGRGTFPFRDLKSFIRGRTDIIFTTELHGESHAAEGVRNLKEFLA